MRTRARSRRWSAAVGTAVLAAAALGTPAAAEEEARPGRCPSASAGPRAGGGDPGAVPPPAPGRVAAPGRTSPAPEAGGSGPGVEPRAVDPATVTPPAPATVTPPAPEAGDGACAPPVVPPPLMNLRRVTLGAAGGKPGDRVRVTGVGFTPGAAVTVEGRAAATPTADRARATADARGAMELELPVADRATTGVLAYEGPAWSPPRGSAPAPYAVSAPDPGTLTLTQEGAAVTLGAVAYGGGGAAPGRIGTVTVKDTRIGGGRWKLTATLTGFTGRDAAGAAGAVPSWTPSCRGGCTAGPAGAAGPEGAVLATGGGGTATVDAALTLTLPAYTPPGAYRAVLTLTLVPL
ncbi:beta-xylosidase [Streptomyces sp. NPDC004126]|uniref:beta-xylosidase n=1 Tax=Streptomyces sp. NPDC004126 TaxID=3390695 RepID=UPI003D003399